MLTKQKYIEYLAGTPINYSCTDPAEYLDSVSQDVVSNCLKQALLKARHLWYMKMRLTEVSPTSYQVIGFRVRDRRLARSPEMSKLENRRTEGGLPCGMGIMNLYQPGAKNGAILPSEFRFQAKEAEK